MGYQISLDKIQLQRIVEALRLLEDANPAEKVADLLAINSPDTWDSDHIRYLLGCAEDTLNEPEGDTLHGWNM